MNILRLEIVTYLNCTLVKEHFLAGSYLLSTVDLNHSSFAIIYIIVHFTLRLFQQKHLKIALSDVI